MQAVLKATQLHEGESNFLGTSRIALAFGAAIFHALWNVMQKQTKDLDAASAGVFTVALTWTLLSSWLSHFRRNHVSTP